jgi:hypothetical protein
MDINRIKYNSFKIYDKIHLLRKKLLKTRRYIMSSRHEGLPYYSQWESRDLVGKIIRNEMSAADDPEWNKSGAQVPLEYELWGRNACGMACLKMILFDQLGKEFPIVDLARKCMEYGGYQKKGETIDGLYYMPFLSFIKDEYDLDGRIIVPMSEDDIVEEVAKKNYVIASVNHRIRHPEKEFNGRKGGHLVLVSGSNIDTKIFEIHNPSGDTRQSQEYAQVSFRNFNKFFAHRGIVIDNPKYTKVNR